MIKPNALNKRRDHVRIGTYTIDVFVSEQHSIENEITDYPVESGSDITDNVRKKPRTVTIEGLVSDTPVGDIAALRQTTSANTDLDSITTPFGTVTGQNPALDYLPSLECLAYLESLSDAGEPFSLITTIKTYPQVLLESLAVAVNEETGAALSFNAVFKILRLVTNARTTVRVAAPSNAGQVKQGNKPTTTTTLVNRLVDPSTGAWFDPTMPNPNGGLGRWRYGAQPNGNGLWTFTPGPPTLSDLDEQGGLVGVHVDKATGQTIVNPGQQLQVINGATAQPF